MKSPDIRSLSLQLSFLGWKSGCAGKKIWPFNFKYPVAKQKRKIHHYSLCSHANYINLRQCFADCTKYKMRPHIRGNSLEFGIPNSDVGPLKWNITIEYNKHTTLCQ